MTKKIKIYSKMGCVYCHNAKDFFIERGIEFEDVDVEEDAAGLMEMEKKSGQLGVPVIEIDGEIIIGFDRPEIKRKLQK